VVWYGMGVVNWCVKVEYIIFVVFIKELGEKSVRFFYLGSKKKANGMVKVFLPNGVFNHSKRSLSINISHYSQLPIVS
jgi:hypothetical protein